MAYSPVRGNVYWEEPVVVPLSRRVGIRLENGFHDLDGGLAEACHVEGEASSLRRGFDRLGPHVEAK